MKYQPVEQNYSLGRTQGKHWGRTWSHTIPKPVTQDRIRIVKDWLSNRFGVLHYGWSLKDLST